MKRKTKMNFEIVADIIVHHICCTREKAYEIANRLFKEAKQKNIDVEYLILQLEGYEE